MSKRRGSKHIDGRVVDRLIVADTKGGLHRADVDELLKRWRSVCSRAEDFASRSPGIVTLSKAEFTAIANVVRPLLRRRDTASSRRMARDADIALGFDCYRNVLRWKYEAVVAELSRRWGLSERRIKAALKAPERLSESWWQYGPGEFSVEMAFADSDVPRSPLPAKLANFSKSGLTWDAYLKAVADFRAEQHRKSVQDGNQTIRRRNRRRKLRSISALG